MERLDFIKKPKTSQLDLGIHREPEPDRNYHMGGRSFYFFDLDDNVWFLTTPIYIYHKKTNKELAITTQEYALHSQFIGKQGLYGDYEIRLGAGFSFRRFRDALEKGAIEPFHEDLMSVVKGSELEWRGPSWGPFYHATFNRRPTSLITARGHSPEVIKSGIELLVREGHLPNIPNYLSVYPVTNPAIQNNLMPESNGLNTAELKFKAIIKSVETAMEKYGNNPHHRFGMSDDDQKNLELIVEAMRSLKKKYPENSFFVIHSKEDHYVKQEVYQDHLESELVLAGQMSLFDDEES